MSKHEKDGLMDCLFSRQDMKLINVKFFRGGSDIISLDEFETELCAAAERKRTGEVVATDVAPRCKRKAIDLLAFVENM